MPRVFPTPLLLAKRSLVGSAIAILGYCALFLPFPHPIRRQGLATLLWSGRLQILVVVLPVLAGLVITYWNQRLIVNGINHLRFTEDALDEARHFINQSWLTVFQVVALIAVVILCIARIFLHSSLGDTAVILFLGVNPLTYLRTTLRKPAHPSAGPRIDWSKVEPMHSNHWGDPPPIQTK